MKRYMVTSGLPYSNGRTHVGHIAGAYLPADTFVRYLRARGRDVRFVCGSDDNGVAALISAEKEGRSVEELTADYHGRQATVFKGMGIEFDIFGGTHQPDYVDRHVQMSQELFLSLHEKGWFTKKATKQLYDTKAGRFLPDRYVQGTCYHKREDGSPCRYERAFGDQCESCGKQIEPLELIDPRSTITGTTPEPRETTHWYLQLQRMESPLREWLESKRAPEEGAPWRDTVLNFTLGQVKNGLPERAMTRDLDWGIPVPLDDPEAQGKVLYVWFDAPIGYVSFTASLCERDDGDWRGYERWWKSPDTRIFHFIGEDNTVFHALTWPAVLMADGSFQLPHQVVSNAFLNVKLPGRDEEKVSKSRGTAIWIEDYLERFDADALRYYLTAIAPETRQTTFDLEEFVARNNGELLAAFGNFVNRTMTFVHRYFDGVVPDPGERTELDRRQLQTIRDSWEKTTALLEGLKFKSALAEVMGLARASNVYLDAKAPWKQRKEDLAACGTTMNLCVQTSRALATLIAPFLPFTGQKCARMLGQNTLELPWDGAIEEIEAGRKLGEAEILVRKLEVDDVLTLL